MWEVPTTAKKANTYWLNHHSTSSRYTSVLGEKSEDQRHKTGPENAPKPSPIYITGVKNISPLIQLLEQIAKQQYKIKALGDNQD
jgi:hypothetical protein